MRKPWATERHDPDALAEHLSKGALSSRLRSSSYGEVLRVYPSTSQRMPAFGALSHHSHFCLGKTLSGDPEEYSRRGARTEGGVHQLAPRS